MDINMDFEKAKDVLSQSSFSVINTKTTDTPFFMPSYDSDITLDDLLDRYEKTNDREKNTALQNLVETTNLPPLLYHIYDILDSTKREFSFNTFHFFSLNEIVQRHTAMQQLRQKNICDLACKYYGMGHILVLSWSQEIDCFLLRRDGGSNDYDRQDNLKFITEYNVSDTQDNKRIPVDNLFPLLTHKKLEDLRDWCINH
tara:strand:+ start:113 stop:712 length:600 start_codon:yes stop_codon:yes gene_type:complete